MIVRLDDHTADVEEADDFHRLHVATDLDGDRIDAALRHAGIGRLAENGSAALDIAVLHARAATAGSAVDWELRWGKMIDYATGEGWVSPDGTHVYAHVERPSQRT